MRDLDETDLEILELLGADARRPYREVAEHVGLSPPAVSDRVERLEDQGVIRRFTLDVDRTKLQRRVPAMVEVDPDPAFVEEVFETFESLDASEHVFQLSDGTVQAHVNAPDSDVHGWLRDAVDFDRIDGYEVTHVAKYEWQSGVSPVDFSLSCAVCDNPVRSDGVTANVDGSVKAFCCPSCESQYREKYESLTE